MRISKLYSGLILGAVVLLGSCSAGGDDTGYEFAPNMYNSFAYEPMTQLEEEPNTINPHGMNMREPVKNTVARGQFDYGKYDMKVSNESYEASASLKNPLPSTAKNIAEGNRLYNINCTPCHGEKGAGDGTIVAAGKFPPPPDYNSDRIKTTPDGKMFYSIKYGKNLMGAYGTVMSPEQIWQVIHYIHSVNGTSPVALSTTK